MRQPESELDAVSQSLARELRGYARRSNVVVLALKPTVVPLAARVAWALDAPLDLFLVRLLVLDDAGGVAIGAVASGGVLVVDPGVVKAHAVPVATIAEVGQDNARQLTRHEQAYRGDEQPLDLRQRQVIVVSDGSADLFAWRMTIAALRRRWVAGVVVAAPTMPASICRAILREVDEVVAALTDEPATGVAAPGQDDHEVRAEEVARLLEQASPATGARASA